MIEVYVLDSNGVPFFFISSADNSQANIEDITLFSGGITAIQSFLNSTNVGEVSSFTTNERIVTLKRVGNYNIVLVIDLDQFQAIRNVDSYLNQLSESLAKLSKKFSSFGQNQYEYVNEEFAHYASEIVKKMDAEANMDDTTRKLMDSLW